jgi:hypothetical protein
MKSSELLATKPGAGVHLCVCARDGLFMLAGDAPEPIPFSAQWHG